MPEAEVIKALPENAPDPYLFMSDIPGLFVADPEVVHRYRRGARIRWQGAWYEINTQGWRGPEWPKVKEKDDVVLCLGDSITFGYGVPFETTFCKRLEVLLKEKFPRNPPIVFNAASDNYNTEQEVRIFKELLPLLRPDIVIVNFYRNDIYPSLFNVDDQGRLCLLPEPEVSSPSSPFHNFYSSLLPHSFLLKFLDQRIGSVISFWALQVSYNATGSREARYWQEAEQRLRELVQLARRSHAQVLFAYFPDLHELGILKIRPSFYRFRRISHNLQVPLIDIRESLQRHLREKLYRKGDPFHLNERGHRLAAQALVEVIEPLLKNR